MAIRYLGLASWHCRRGHFAGVNTLTNGWSEIIFEDGAWLLMQAIRNGTRRRHLRRMSAKDLEVLLEQGNKFLLD